jgi:hypothetical protein
MSKPRLHDKGIGPLGDISTVYRDTIDSVAPATSDTAFDNSGTCRILTATAAKHLNPTDTILNSGTSRITCQLPGYSGHIPRNLRNHKKQVHAYREQSHAVQNDLLLTTKISILGYTGMSLLN